MRNLRLHCATSKSSLRNMEYVARGGAFERPRIYRTDIHTQCIHFLHQFSVCTIHSLRQLYTVLTIALYTHCHMCVCVNWCKRATVTFHCAESTPSTVPALLPQPSDAGIYT